MAEFTFDANNYLLVDVATGGGSNASVGATGTTAPASATEIGIIVGGNLVGVSSANPVPVSGSFASGSLTNNNAAPSNNNEGVLPAIANAANPSWTEGYQVLQSVDLSGNQRVKVNAALPTGTNVIGHVIADSGSTTAVTGNVTVVQGTGTNLHTVIDSGTLTTVSTVTAVTAITNALPAGTNVIGHVIADSGSTTAVTGTVTVAGNKTNNNAAPGATNVGTLSAVANAAAQSWTEGDQVALSVDLSGHQRVVATGAAAADAAQSGNPVLVGGVDAFGNIQELPICDNGNTGTVQTLIIGGTDGVNTAHTIGIDTSGNLPVARAQAGADGTTNANVGQLFGGTTSVIFCNLGVDPYLFNGTTWDRSRTPNKFFTAQVNASTTGNSAVWTPTSGKKFRLMRFQITAQGLAATATGVVTVTFQDATTQINTGAYDVDVPAVANVVSGTDNISGAWIDLGNGIFQQQQTTC